MKQTSAGTVRRAFVLLLALCMLLSAAACASGRSEEPKALSDCGVIHEPEFGGVYIKNTIEEFNALGFEYGDSVTVAFSNGYVLEDIPYYNGYYTATGEPLLIAYPGYDYIKAAINNGDDLWLVAALQEDALASVTLFERGKYADIQNARDIHYTDERTDYASDEVFANFRSVKAGNLKENVLFRSASPCDNQHNRAPYVDALIANAGVNFILDLADNDEKVQTYLQSDTFNSPYFLSLYEAGRVAPIALKTNYAASEFKAKLAAGLREMTTQEGPYLVHCTEGKDRTGFVCMLLGMLCGADYDELVADYMLTYENYYGITKESQPEKYDVIVEHVLHEMMETVTETDPAALSPEELSASARRYLKAGGMDTAQIDSLQERLTAAAE